MDCFQLPATPSNTTTTTTTTIRSSSSSRCTVSFLLLCCCCMMIVVITVTNVTFRSFSWKKSNNNNHNHSIHIVQQQLQATTTTTTTPSLSSFIQQHETKHHQQQLIRFSSSQKDDRDLIVDNNSNNIDRNKKRVKVDVYVESLCIDSKVFVLNQLVPTYQILGPLVIQLSVISFGNAKYEENTEGKEQETTTKKEQQQQLICQHGNAECDANGYEQCVADIYNYNIDRYLPYYSCLFDVLPMGHNDNLFDSSYFASCARQAAMDWYLIKECHNNEQRMKHLQYRAYQATKPTNHTYVPWIQINNIHWNESTNETFFNKVCQLYMKQGGIHPACNDNLNVFTAVL